VTLLEEGCTVKAQAIKDMPVVSMADGTKIGNVQELLFDTSAWRLAALLLTAGGGKSLLPFEAVRSFGNDVITVENVAATQGTEGNAAAGNLRGLKDLAGLRVINGEGTWLGDVRDVELAVKDGAVEQISVRKGGMLGLGGTNTSIPAAAIRGIGPKVMTVDVPEAAASSPAAS
jgi:sporulation protein YlmC with PRC-barrel domain